MNDPYQTLGIARTASPDEIKTAYRRLARTLHPDLNPGDARAEERFKEVSAAYDLLSDSTKRGRFDRGEIDAGGQERGYGGGGPRRSSRGGGGFGFGGEADEIFAEFLRRKAKVKTPPPGGPGKGQGSRGLRGKDASYTLRVSFTDSTAGATKRITLPTGKALNVKIPPGTIDGTTLRLKGQGGEGVSGGENGDALVEIKVEPHAFFERDGRDVRIEIPITLAEAVLGGKITVPTLDGKVSVGIPANSSSGTVLRLKGKGIAVDGQPAGDQLVSLKIVLPEKPDAELEAFMRKWAAASANPREKAGIG